MAKFFYMFYNIYLKKDVIFLKMHKAEATVKCGSDFWGRAADFAVRYPK